MQVTALSNVVAIATGELFAWGGNQMGEIGNGTTVSPQKTPVSISAGDLD